MAPGYYGSAFADQVVRAYRAWCRKHGHACDEPGAGGVQVTREVGGRLVAEVTNRDGKVFRCARLANGRLQELRVLPEAPNVRLKGQAQGQHRRTARA